MTGKGGNEAGAATLFLILILLVIMTMGNNFGFQKQAASSQRRGLFIENEFVVQTLKDLVWVLYSYASPKS